jgi:hypothetical protein
MGGIDTSIKAKTDQNLQSSCAAANTAKEIWPEAKKNWQTATGVDIDGAFVKKWGDKLSGKNTSVNFMEGEKQGCG